MPVVRRARARARARTVVRVSGSFLDHGSGTGTGTGTTDHGQGIRPQAIHSDPHPAHRRGHRALAALAGPVPRFGLGARCRHARYDRAGDAGGAVRLHRTPPGRRARDRHRLLSRARSADRATRNRGRRGLPRQRPAVRAVGHGAEQATAAGRASLRAVLPAPRGDLSRGRGGGGGFSPDQRRPRRGAQDLRHRSRAHRPRRGADRQLPVRLRHRRHGPASSARRRRRSATRSTEACNAT